MEQLSLTKYELSLITEALERASSRRASMSRVKSTSARRAEEHAAISEEMKNLRNRLLRKQAA